MITKEVPHYLQNLNEQQLAAALHVDGPILILAGAGSGKTRVLTHRVVHLVLEHNVHPRSILAVTFTNKATEEMRERLKGLLGHSAEQLWVATFHSACLRVLRRHAHLLSYSNDFAVYDDQDTKAVLKKVLKDLSIDPQKESPNLFRKIIETAKNSLIGPEEYAKQSVGMQGSLNAEVYDRYQKELIQSNAMDFSDLLFNAVRLFQEFPDTLQLYRSTLHYILVDEFQDTNLVQYQLVRLLAEPQRNLLVVGDDDQSIYAFRGATVEHILHFEKDFPETKVITLEQNYRSTGNILEAAHSVIEKNESRKPKKLWTASGSGSPIYTFSGRDESSEACFVADEIAQQLKSGRAPEDIAVFYRVNAQSRALEEALLDHGIAYRIYGGQKFYERKEVKDMLAYLRLLVNPHDNYAFARVLNTPPRGIGAQTLKRLIEQAKGEQSSLWTASSVMQESNKNLRTFITLITELTDKAAHLSLAELMSEVFVCSGYKERLEKSTEITALSRIENVQELQAIGLSMEHSGNTPAESLQMFLDRVVLTATNEVPEVEHKAAGEKSDDPNSAKVVSLMTLHLAKGLEFPVVFATGMEEGLLPHYRSLEEGNTDEERRLCYVGITRAIETLYLTRAVTRGMFSAGGGFGFTGRYRERSRFLFDIPTQYVETKGDEPGYNDLWEDEVFEDDDSTAEDPWNSSKEVPALRMRKKKTNGKKPSLSELVSPADEMLSLAPAESIAPGVAVRHPSFGTGIVECVDGNPAEDPLHARITVRFEEYESTKRLVWSKAKLSLAG